MKKLVIALAAIFAATLLSGNAFAFSPSQAKGVHAANAVVQVSNIGYRHYYRHHHYRHCCGGCYRPCCYSCGCYRTVYYYGGCGSCYGGCGVGWGGCGGGWGFPVFGWFF